jgi:hypothetical protein
MLLGVGTSTPTPDPSTPRLSKMRSFFNVKGKAKDEGQMVPAKAGPSGRSRPVTERDVKEVQAGLLRCIRTLVAKLRAVGLLKSDFEINPEGWKTLDPYLLRALCEIVRAEEDRLVSLISPTA